MIMYAVYDCSVVTVHMRRKCYC